MSVNAPISARELPGPVREACLAIRKKGFGGARPVVRSLLEKHPELDDLHAYNALLTLWSGDMDRAYNLAYDRWKTKPSAGLAAIVAETALFLANDAEEVEFRQHGVHLDADHFLVLRHLIGKATLDGRYNEAIQLAERALGFYPEDPEFYSSMISAAHAGGQSEYETQLLDEAPAWFVETAQYHNKRGMRALVRREIDEAEDQLRLAVAMCAEGGAYWGHLSMVLRTAAKFDEAERAAEFALDLNSRDVVAMSTMAVVARRKGDQKGAQEWLERADEAIPGLKAQSILRKVSELVRQNKPEAATALLRSATTQNFPYVVRTARKILVQHSVRHGKWAEARKELDLLRATQDEDPSLPVMEFSILAHENKPEEAKALLEALLAIPPIHPELYAFAIPFMKSQGDSDRIETLAQSAISNLPGPPYCLAATVMALTQAGFKEQAQELHTAALRRYPEDSSLILIGAGLSADSGNLQAALRATQGLPAHLRPQIRLVKGFFWKAGFWKALFRAFFQRKKDDNQ